MERALARAKRIEEGWCFAELLRKNVELLLVRGESTDVASAEECFRQALEWATPGRSLVGAAERDEPCTALPSQGRTPRRAKCWPPVYGGSQKGSRPPTSSRESTLDALR